MCLLAMRAHVARDGLSVMRTAFFTIASWNYLFFARAWAESVHAAHPDADVILFLADVERPDFAAGPLFDTVIPVLTLDIAEPLSRLFRYNAMELNTSLKPAAFLELFTRGYSRAIYLDSDVLLYAPITKVTDALDQGANSVITPHGTKPNENELTPNEINFLQAGIYNLGFMAVEKTDETVALLQWWARRLERLCINDQRNGIFVDQKWIDLWPAYCEGVKVLRDPAYNVAYWNLDQRTLSLVSDRFVVDDAPLVFFHFSGLVPGDRGVLSKYQSRLQPNYSTTLQSLLDDYHDRLERHGQQEFLGCSYGFGYFDNGAPIPDAARRVFRERLEPYSGNPFSDLPTLLNLPAQDVLPNPHGMITRLGYELWRSRSDLSENFNLRDAGSQIQFAKWLVADRGESERLPGFLLEPVLAGLRLWREEQDVPLQSPSPAEPTGGRSQWNRATLFPLRWAGRLALSHLHHLRPLYSFIPANLRRRVASRIVDFCGE